MLDGACPVPPPGRLRRRADFLVVGKSPLRYVRRGMIVQMTARKSPLPSPKKKASPADTQCRVGLTVSRKIGSAVIRNRVKRRFRALVRHTPKLAHLTAYDIVIVARVAIRDMDFQQIVKEFDSALSASLIDLHKEGR